MGKGRPLSLVFSENNKTKSPRGTPDPHEQEEAEISRADVARSLEGKDPSWFRQTADRGMGSAAFRRNQGTDSSTNGVGIQLPGMSTVRGRQSGGASMDQPDDGDKRSSGESVSKSTFSNPRSSTTMTSSTRSKSPLPLLPSQQLEPSQRDSLKLSIRNTSPARGLAMSPSQRSLSPDRMDRPASPTKGAGGFVQSAMLKRSDSINKHMRANSQATQSLSRTSSFLSTHNETNNERGLDTSTVSSNTSKTLEAKPEDSNGFKKPALPSRTPSQRQEQGDSADTSAVSPPTTPSRTLEPRRWSPTKTTWLENAIQKSDSPKPKASPQKPPLWLSELQKSKQPGSSSEEAKPASHKPVEVGGFLRTPPLGSASKSPSSEGFPTPSTNNKVTSPNRTDTIPPVDGGADLKLDNARKIEPRTTPLTSPDLLRTESPRPSPKPEKATEVRTSHQAEQVTRKTSETSKSKPETPPKKDFRSNLKSHEFSKDNSTTEEAEFKNVFGRLKKTETKNYVAPDELKDNITRGKAGLSITGGPRKYEKRDDFKDSILKKKEEMKTGGSVRGRPTPAPKPADPAIPEALARQRGLATKSLVRTPSAEQPKPEPQKQTSVPADSAKMVPIEKKSSAPARLQVGISSSSSNLADRFNPSLAGIIARGPSPMSQAAPPPRNESPQPVKGEEGIADFSKATELTHTTKSRARGPKRRLPASSKVVDASVPETNPESVDESARSELAKSVSEPKAANVSTSRALPNASASPVERSSERSVSRPKPLNVAASKPVAESSRSSQATNDAKIASPPSKTSSFKAQESKSSPNLAQLSLSPTLVPKTPPAVKPKRVASETKPTEDNKPAPRTDASLSPTSTKSKVLSPKSPKSPPIPSDKSKAIARITSNVLSSPQIREPSPPKQASPKRPAPVQAFGEFFDNTSSSGIKARIDVPTLLTSTSGSDGKIKTLRKEIWELSGDGKKTSLASHQEHILFEEKMYLCKHVFGSSTGKRTTEVYLWCGDLVSQSAIEDAQLFARNEAKDAGGKLQVLAQGKEPPNFFEALGGIVITRKTSTATYTLCGRRHMGHIAFDEVEHAQQSLCSGFPYIVSALDGDLYLWKGRGSNADELGCARLIGMDLNLTGEIREIDEGSEPSAFFEALKSAGSELPLADYWSKKGSAEKYETRLFAIDTDARPKSSSGFTGLFTRRQSAPSNEDSSGQIKEVSPYSQADIANDGIYMLDAFFEIFM